MHGLGFDLDVREWFASGARGRRKAALPAPQVAPDLVARALAEATDAAVPGLRTEARTRAKPASAI